MPRNTYHIHWPNRINWPLTARSNAAPSSPRCGPGPGGFSVALRPVTLTLDQILGLVCLSLLGIGLVMVHSANARISDFSRHWFIHFFISSAALHMLLAVLAMCLVWRFDYRRLIGRSLPLSAVTFLLIAALLLLALVLTHLGTSINGARRWLLLRTGSHAISFEPSELAKWSLVLFISAYAMHREDKIRDFLRGFLPLTAIIGITCILILKEDFGTAALIAGVSAILMLMAGCRWWHLAILVPGVLVLGYFAVWHIPYRRERLLIFLHPHLDPRGAGYNPIQSLLSFSSGGFWGRGLGNGIQKLGYLPEANTDFIFSLIAEELGFFGCMVVVSLYLILTICGWRIVCRARDLFGKMAGFGCTAMISLQAAMNIAVATVSVPTKGIALPLISSGGTSWILTAAAIGLLMSIERTTRMEMTNRLPAATGQADRLLKLPAAAANDSVAMRTVA